VSPADSSLVAATPASASSSAAQTGAPIGSLYHFFAGGKEELVADALRDAGAG
jgi:hypothetical protein